jgi:hypothetical protein
MRGNLKKNPWTISSPGLSIHVRQMAVEKECIGGRSNFEKLPGMVSLV